MKLFQILAALLGLVILTGCNSESQTAVAEAAASLPELTAQPKTGRWYRQDEALAGRQLFATNCASCHGRNAVGTADWRTPNSNGQYPPPPLNGSAHAWHHSYEVLQRVILEGGAPMGGTMPAWRGRLSAEEIRQVIAGFQSYWPDQAYQIWVERERQSR